MVITDFRAGFPEFNAVSPTMVQSHLDETALELAAADWGNRFDTAHGLLTASRLWSSPFGATMRLDNEGNKRDDPYLEQYENLVRKTFIGALVT